MVVPLSTAGVKTLKLRSTAEASTWSAWSETFQSHADLTIKSGATLGVFGLFTPVEELVFPLPESTCEEYPVEGKVTELGASCSGFSTAAAKVHHGVAWYTTRTPGWRAQMRPTW